jgi:putative PIN family toxin of toxin-antitoxin system
VKIILDTNVLVSGIFFKGVPFNILTEWKRGKFKLVVSHSILNEYNEVVVELSKKYSTIEADQILEKIALNSKIYFEIALSEQICDDPDDDKFFALAMASKTKIIISGDKHLLQKSGYSGIKVLKPTEFFFQYLRRT